MPGSVINAAPATVLPWGLCKAFSHSREYAVLENEYKNGESQRSKLVSTSCKSWRINRRLTPAALATLQAFYDARKGPQEPFFYYDPHDSGFTYDPTGVQVLGRYTVRFEGAWNQTVGIGRVDVDISLVELA
jgi:hypothetical protein